jgi:WD40 repeat protein
MNRVVRFFALAACVAPGDNAPAREPQAQLPGAVSSFLTFSPDGKYLAVPGQDGVLHLWEIAAKKERPLAKKTQVSQWSVAFSPDGKYLAAGCLDNSVRVWEVATGKKVHHLRGHASTVYCAIFSPDGKVLATGGEDQTIRLWSLATGKVLREIDGTTGGIWPLAFAPDGKTLAAGYATGAVILWDAATGKKARQLRGHEGGVWPLVFSADGRTLASCVWQANTVVLWDAVTGKVRRTLQVPPGVGWSLALSPDSRTLLSGGADAVVYCWEVATGMERARFLGHKAGVNAVAFSASGRQAASTDGKGQIAIWDVPGLPKKVSLGARDLISLWTDLRDADAAKAYRAVWTLTAAPRLTVPFLRERLRPKPTAVPDRKRIVRLIADLDHKKFQARRNATIALEKLGKVAEKALRKAALNSPTPEVRLRIDELLRKLESQGLAPDELQAFRGLEALELLGSAEARKVFEDLAKQEIDSWLSQEAKASLVRLARRDATR